MDDVENAAPVRIALLGTGVFARKAHAPALAAHPDRFEIVAVYSRTLANAQRLVAEQFPRADACDDLDVLLSRDDVEAVDVVLPIPVLADTVQRAFGARKHVVSEKPIAETTSRGRQLIASAPADRVWMVGENWRYEAAFLAAASALEASRIGRPVTFDWAVHAPKRPGHQYYATEWRRSGVVPGGFLLDAGVHFAAVLRMLLGEPTAAHGLTASTFADLPPADTLAAALRFEGGCVGTLTTTHAVGTPWPGPLRVVGTAGALLVTPTRLEVWSAGEHHVSEFPRASGVRDQLAAFGNSVRTGAPHANTPREALADLDLMERLLSAVI